MRIGSIASVVGMLGISFFLVSTPVLAQSGVSSGADCPTTTASDPVNTVSTSVTQAAAVASSSSDHKDCGLFGAGCWDWGRIGSDALHFGAGLAVGAVTAVAATALIAAAVATFPAWGTAIVVGAAVVGVAALGYGVYSTVKNWNNMSEGDKFFLGGNVVGGIIGGGFSGAVTRGVTGFIGTATEPVAAGASEAVSTAAADIPKAVPPVRGSIPASDAWNTVGDMFNNSNGLKIISGLKQQGASLSGDDAAATLDGLANGIKAKYGLNIKYVDNGVNVPNLDEYVPGQHGNYGTWSEADNTIYFRNGIRSNPQQWTSEFGHEYGAYLLGGKFGGKGMIPRVSGGGYFQWPTHMLDMLIETGGKNPFAGH